MVQDVSYKAQRAETPPSSYLWTHIETFWLSLVEFGIWRRTIVLIHTSVALPFYMTSYDI